MAATHLDVGLRCIKYLLCAVNSLFVLTGIMIIFVGIKTLAIFDDFHFFLSPIHCSPASLLVVVGILTCIIAFFGCYGAIRESTCMVLVFAVSLSLVLILEVTAAITAYVLQDGITDFVAHRMTWLLFSYYDDLEAAMAVDFLQSKLRCCGVQSSADWLYINDSSPTGIQPYPKSCYSWIAINDETGSYNGQVHQIGCMNKLTMLIHRSALNLGTAAMAIALIQLTGIMFACTLGRAIRRQKTDRERRRWEFRENLVNGYQPLGKNDPQTTYPVIYMLPEFEAKKPIDS